MVRSIIITTSESSLVSLRQLIFILMLRILLRILRHKLGVQNYVVKCFDQDLVNICILFEVDSTPEFILYWVRNNAAVYKILPLRI